MQEFTEIIRNCQAALVDATGAPGGAEGGRVDATGAPRGGEGVMVTHHSSSRAES